MSHRNESCHIWASHVTYEWVMSHMNESCLHLCLTSTSHAISHVSKSCHIWMSHVTYEWVMSHMNESCHIWMTRVSYEWVMSHMNESCLLLCLTSTSHAISHVSKMYTHIYIYIYSCPMWMSHVPRSVSHEWVMQHTMWVSHVPRECGRSWGVKDKVFIWRCEHYGFSYMVSTIRVNSRWKQVSWLTDFRHAESVCIFQDNPYGKIGFPVYGVNRLCS